MMDKLNGLKTYIALALSLVFQFLAAKGKINGDAAGQADAATDQLFQVLAAISAAVAFVGRLVATKPGPLANDGKAVSAAKQTLGKLVVLLAVVLLAAQTLKAQDTHFVGEVVRTQFIGTGNAYYGADPVALAATYQHLGDSQAAMGDHKAAVESYRAALSILVPIVPQTGPPVIYPPPTIEQRLTYLEALTYENFEFLADFLSVTLPYAPIAPGSTSRAKRCKQ